MTSLRGQVALVGAADTAVGKLPDASPMQLAAEAALAAIADAGLSKDQVDGLVTCNAMAEPLMYPGEALAEYLQIFPKFCIGVGAGGGTTFSILHHAASAIVNGLCETVVVTMADCMRTGLSREASLKLQSSSSHPQFEAPFAPPVASLYALLGRAHMNAYGTTPEQFAAVAVNARANAVLNPAAQMRKPISVDDVLQSRPIADPLHMLDCSLVSDGGAAVVLTSAERAKDLPHTPVYLLGVGEGYGHEHVSQAQSLTTSSAVHSGKRAYEMAGITPAEVQLALLYDCFTPVVLIELEDLGFCAKGEGGPFVESGAVGLGGQLPLNTHGGLLSHCHPGNPGSMFALTEAVQQFRGNCGPRQVDNLDTALLHAQGGILSSHCTLVLGSAATI